MFVIIHPLLDIIKIRNSSVDKIFSRQSGRFDFRLSLESSPQASLGSKNAMTTATPRPRKKLIYLLLWNFADVQLDYLSKVSLKLSFQYQMKIRKISRRRSRPPKYAERCCFSEDSYEMYKDFQCLCTAFALVIQLFVWWRSHYRSRRG